MKNPPLLFSALLVIIVSACLPLAASERRGKTVNVTLSDGSRITGELLAVKSDTLLVFDLASRQGRSLEADRVAYVKVSKRSAAFLTGLAIGAGLGMVSAFVHARVADHGTGGMGYLYFPPIFGGIGLLSGAISGLPVVFPLEADTHEGRLEALKRLRRYARERDE